MNSVEEADRRVLLHAKHASSKYDKNIISTPGTKRILIVLSKLTDINAHLYMLIRTKDKRSLVDINALGRGAVVKGVEQISTMVQVNN